MWSVTLMGNGEYVADRRMRELGRRLCDECPLQPKCLADARAGNHDVPVPGRAAASGGPTHRCQ